MPRLPLFFYALFLPAAFLAAAERPNVLLLCVDDLRPELACYGVDYIKSPHIDSLAARGRLFTRHYVQAPTCGASRYTLLTGRYGPVSNQALFHRSKKIQHPSLPAHFRRHGYTTVSVGKVSHHPGGLGGPDWDDATQLEMPHSWDRHLMPTGAWQHPRGAMHGLAHGEIRKKASDMDLFQAEEGGDEIYPDGLTTETALAELEKLTRTPEKPFFLAVGLLKPHLPFGAPARYLAPYRDQALPPIPHPEKPAGKTTWHGSGEFMKYQRHGKDPRQDVAYASEVRRHYAACVTYADAQIGKILARLDELGQRDNTLIILWGDHGWHLGEHAIWGKHSLFEESLHAPLIIVSPQDPQPGKSSPAIVESIDLFPTLCELSGLALPAYLHGSSLLPQIQDPTSPRERPAYSYHGKARTLRTATHRYILHRDGSEELYDHRQPDAETRNLAREEAALSRELKAILTAKPAP
ncbi:MAG: sulfatase [Verrucomicrobiales bacterium]